MAAPTKEMGRQRVNAPAPDTGNEVPMPEQAYKRCWDCGEEKPLDAFARDPYRTDGRRSSCRKCYAAYSRKRHDGLNEEQLKKQRERHKEYRARNRDKIRETTQKHAAVRRAHKPAQDAVRFALERGELVRPDECEECGRDAALEAHHDDYSKPLDVDFLCHRCHRNRHTRAKLSGTKEAG